MTGNNSHESQLRYKFKKILEQCELNGIAYKDDSFPSAHQSLISEHNTIDITSITRWVRPQLIKFKTLSTDNEMDLIRSPHPSDIQQGKLGDCWLIAALSLISRREDLLANIFITRQLNSVGIYALRIFMEGEWKCVIIDDFLPVDEHNQLVFSRNCNRQLWVPFVEKAVAKLYGNYASLQGGLISDGLNYLTGFVSETVDIKLEENHELLWNKITAFHAEEFLMGTHVTSTDTSRSENIKRKMGIVPNHVYAILNVVTDKEHRLMQLHNPWGKFSWKGDWSDESTLWTPELKAKFSPTQSDKGIFWISYADFLIHFTTLELSKVRKGWKTTSIQGILPPYIDPDCQTCFELICGQSCQVDIVLYQSYNRNSTSQTNLTDIGLMVLETNGVSSQYRLLKPMNRPYSCRRKNVSCSIILHSGSFCVIPFSFSHWNTKIEDNTLHTFSLTIHSSHNVKLSSIRPTNSANILADALICCGKYYGKIKRYNLKTNNNDISSRILNMGVGHCMILENKSTDKFVELEVITDTIDFISTRSSLRVKDGIPPMHCQVVQVLTSKDTVKTTTHTNSYTLNSSQQYVDGNNESYHHPPLKKHIVGLHIPRPIQIHNITPTPKASKRLSTDSLDKPGNGKKQKLDTIVTVDSGKVINNKRRTRKQPRMHQVQHQQQNFQ